MELTTKTRSSWSNVGGAWWSHRNWPWR